MGICAEATSERYFDQIDILGGERVMIEYLQSVAMRSIHCWDESVAMVTHERDRK
jgi:hypothetical protein